VSITPGLEASVQRVVGPTDTARALGSGDVDVLGTPAVVALCEQAAVAAVADALDPSQTSVGTNITIDHLAPTVVGRTVTARAHLDEVDGRTLRFVVEVSDGSVVVARGTHARVVVDRERFTSGANERA
jgi:predicted thioesterase